MKHQLHSQVTLTLDIRPLFEPRKKSLTKMATYVQPLTKASSIEPKSATRSSSGQSM